MEDKKALLAVIAIVAVIAFVVILVAKPFQLKQMVGTYELIEMSGSGRSYSKEDLEKVKAAGITFKMELKSDKTGEINIAGVTNSLKYDKENFIIGDDKVPYTFKNKTITLERNGSKMVFEKK